MAKAILQDVLLAIIVIALQIIFNRMNGKPNDLVVVISLGLLVGAVDFCVSFFKGKFKSVNYKVSNTFIKKKK